MPCADDLIAHMRVTRNFLRAINDAGKIDMYRYYISIDITYRLYNNTISCITYIRYVSHKILSCNYMRMMNSIHCTLT